MLTFPSKSSAESIYITGLNHTIDNYGKTVTLFFPAYLQPISGLSGVIGLNFMENGSTSFFPADNFLAGGQPMKEVRDSKTINLLCTVNAQNREAKFQKLDTANVNFRKELTYIYGKGYLTEYNNIVNCEYAIFNMPESGIDRMKFRLASQPRDKNSIAQGHYLTCWWEQIA